MHWNMIRPTPCVLALPLHRSGLTHRETGKFPGVLLALSLILALFVHHILYREIFKHEPRTL